MIEFDEKQFESFKANKDEFDQLTGDFNLGITDPFAPSREKKPLPESETRLSWLINDFEGITTSVYEAIMIAAIRARQIGRRQKQEIDSYNSSMEATEIINPEEDDGEEPGVDHFHHIKPTIKALMELKDDTVKFYYPEKDKK